MADAMGDAWRMENIGQFGGFRLCVYGAIVTSFGLG
jgi:hypothetical protein